MYRQVMIDERDKAKCAAKICVKCAGWSSFGNLKSPMCIALYGDICCCDDHWHKLQKLVRESVGP